MKRISNLLLVLVLGLLLVSCLEQKSLPPTSGKLSPTGDGSLSGALDGEPVWAVGDTWQWSDGYGLEVTTIEEDNIARLSRTDVRQQWQKRQGLFIIESQSASTHRQQMYRSLNPATHLFPLVIGKTVVFQREYMANDELRVHRTSWTVEGREKIEVPAGVFDAWVLVRRTRGLQSGWTGYEKWWYCSQVKHYVRLEYRYGDAPAASRVLLSYQVH